MSRLIYCAYATLDQATEPDWVVKLAENPFLKAEGSTLYRPLYGFMENLKLAGPLLARDAKLPKERAAALRLEPALFEPLAAVQKRMEVADHGPFVDVAFKRLYALLRADIVLVDLNIPGHGGRAQEAFYAYLAGVPVVGIAHRFILSPMLVEKMEAVIFPKTSDQIVRQVLACDEKTTAAIEHYRVGEQRERQREQLRAMTEKVSALQAEQERPDGRDESADEVHGTVVSGAV